MERKTHKVIDETYHDDEAGHDVLVGTPQECEEFVAEQGGFGYEIVPMTKEEIDAYPDNQVKPADLNIYSPADFSIYPWSSILQNAESETVALNVMKILKRTGNVWRDLSWEEYKTEREKDGNFTLWEEEHFVNVIKYCKSPDTAKLFGGVWANK